MSTEDDDRDSNDGSGHRLRPGELTPRQQSMKALQYKTAVVCTVLCPLLILMPPRKMDFYTFGLCCTTVYCVNHVMTEHGHPGLLYLLASQPTPEQVKANKRYEGMLPSQAIWKQMTDVWNQRYDDEEEKEVEEEEKPDEELTMLERIKREEAKKGNSKLLQMLEEIERKRNSKSSHIPRSVLGRLIDIDIAPFNLRWPINGFTMYPGETYPLGCPGDAPDRVCTSQIPGTQLQPQLATAAPGTVSLHDDLSAIDFSDPSLQEYLINNDMLGDIIFDRDNSTSHIMDPESGFTNSTSSSDLLLNTPMHMNSPGDGVSVNTGALAAQVDRFSAIQEETTLSLGIIAHLEYLENQIVEMKQFVARGFARRDHLRSFEVEKHRLRSRNYNFQNVTEINESFEPLLQSNGELPARYPVNGVELKNLSHEEINALLDVYDLPFSPAMFLHEKQLIYLKFIGANRAIMHRVVD
ncbi:hypothetical protein Dda_4776 [Drechslerella dactyloides]|uniref:Uncharacterized protein n=1 Tax=Drechslerella dactyloides TaxID=74499 RepID=A0AAD6IZS5_DREDA|nr:hypothetical protein Dda_4776 [Drechslerella dactyloides]